jgi:hypothetical protein
VTWIESVESVAVMVAVPAVVDLTENVAVPVLSVVAEMAVIVSVAPRLDAMETVLFETPFPLESLRVTVTVEVATPSGIKVAGFALMVD